MSRFIDIRIDPAVIKQAATGDRKAHEILYRAFATPVYSLCLRFTRVPVHAEDLLQDTFIEVMRSIGQFRGESPLGGWIRQVAVSKALMFLRSSWQRQGQSLDDDWELRLPDSPTAAGSNEEAIDLESALDRLPDVARAIVWLHDVEGFTHKEIAVFMGRSESFSKSQLSRAHRKLRPMLSVPEAGKKLEPHGARQGTLAASQVAAGDC